jgi:hypothetical protein
MQNARALVDRYIASFNETDPHRRRDLIKHLYTSDCGYTDPNVELSGHKEIDEFVAAVQSNFRGYLFSLGGPVDAHHDQARFNWLATAPAASEPAYVGFDVIIAADGQIQQVYGFIDHTPDG